MPSVAITSANSGKPERYQEPHERKSGPWDEWEMDDAGRTMERADKIRGNPKFVEAIAKHHEKKAAHHRKLAEGMKSHMKRGLVSEKAAAKASEKHA